MRIAISGAHRTGKSTLVKDLHQRLPDHLTVEEPYDLLEEEGYAFADPPSVEDFEAQLQRSIQKLEESGPRTLFDRCPVDFLAHLTVDSDGKGFDFGEWDSRVQAAMEALDIVILVRVEDPDRIALSPGEDPELRQEVDEELERILVENTLGLEVEVLQVSGARPERVEQVMSHLRRRPR